MGRPRRRADRAAGRVADRQPLRAAVRRRMARARCARRGGTGRGPRRARRQRGARRAPRVRPGRAAHRAWLPAARVPVAVVQRPHRRLRRQPRESAALPARGVRRRARRVAGRPAARRARVRDRLDRRRLDARRDLRVRAAAARARLRLPHGVERRHVVEAADPAGRRPPVAACRRGAQGVGTADDGRGHAVRSAASESGDRVGRSAISRHSRAGC